MFHIIINLVYILHVNEYDLTAVYSSLTLMKQVLSQLNYFMHDFTIHAVPSS